MKNQNDTLSIIFFAILFLSSVNSFIQNNQSFFGIDRLNPQASNASDLLPIKNNQIEGDREILINNLESQVYTKINEYRIKQGLNKLKLDNRISEIAKNHSIRMANKEVSFGDRNLEERSILIKEFLPYQSINEAISYNLGYPNPARVTVNSWISNPEFVDSIQGNHEFTGIGVARSVTGEYYFTQIFVNPL